MTKQERQKFKDDFKAIYDERRGAMFVTYNVSLNFVNGRLYVAIIGVLNPNGTGGGYFDFPENSITAEGLFCVVQGYISSKFWDDLGRRK